MGQPAKLRSIVDAVSLIRTGDVVAIGGLGLRRHPMALVREIARQGKRDLHIVGVGNRIDFDLLVGAGCVAVAESAGVSMDAFGAALSVRRATDAGVVRLIEHTPSVAMDRFRAGALGVPLIPTRAGGEADPNVRPLTNPFGDEDCLAVEAITPDVAIIHAHTADRFGNVQLDRAADPMADVFIARAARTTIVSVEQIVSPEAIAARSHETILTADVVDAVVEAPYGAYPTSCDARYEHDAAFLERYQAAAMSSDSFAAWLADHVEAPADHAATLARIGMRRLCEITLRATVA